jgi:hypothetical protein
MGYRNGSGVGQVVRRLEQESGRDKELKAKLDRLRDEISKLSRVESRPLRMKYQNCQEWRVDPAESETP